MASPKVNCEVFLKVQMKLLKAGLRARVGMMREVNSMISGTMLKTNITN
jgi:hypothetical protein